MHNVVSSKFKTLPLKNESKTHATPDMHVSHDWSKRSSWHILLKYKSSKPDVGIPNSVQRLESLCSTKLVFQSPALQVNHGVDNAISTVLLSSYNKQSNNRTKQTDTHTRDPRRRPTSHDRSQRENKGQLFQLIRTFVKKVGVWKESESEVISLMHATHLKFKTSAK